MGKVKVGISIGDINGVGLEVILKTLTTSNIINFCIPVIYGSSKVVSYHKNIVGIEDFEDIKADFQQAIARTFEEMK